MTRSSRAERVRRLLEDSKDDSSASSENKPNPCPFEMPSTSMNDESKDDDSTAGTGEEELKIEIGSFAGVDGIDSIDFEVLDRHPLPSSLSLKSDQEVEGALFDTQLQSRKQYKSSSFSVRSIDVHSNPGTIDEWIFDVEEAHAAKRASSTINALPDLQALMQAWPQEMENALASGDAFLPPADVDLSLEEYAKVLCALFSIPVEETKLVGAIHKMMSLYMECQDRKASCDISKDISVNLEEWS